MDSGRKALLERAREFGSLARSTTFQEILNKSVTYRTLARYLGIEDQWWGEFWRSFSFAIANGTQEQAMSGFCFLGTAKEISYIVWYLSIWFGEDRKISEIPVEEFRHESSAVVPTVRKVRAGIK